MTFMARLREGRTRLFPLTWVAVVAVVLVWGCLFSAPAVAEDPFRVSSQIEDKAGALSGREGDVHTALDALQSSRHVQLWLVFVKTFSGLSGQDWADQTFTKSDLGLNDVLLAVATEDRDYAYLVDQDFPLADSQLNEVMTASVEPALTKNDWAGAAIGAATGIAQALGGQVAATAATSATTVATSATTVATQAGSTAATGAPAANGNTEAGGGFPWGVLIVVIVLAVVGLFVGIRVWRSHRPSVSAKPAQDAGSPQTMTLQELRGKVGRDLVATDDAIKTSTDELGFAVAEFGEAQAAPFRQALDEAGRDLNEAFKLHRQLDEHADEQAQRQLLTAVLQLTTAANETLDAQVEHFDKLRDLEQQAPQVLAEVEQQLTALEARIPQVREELAQLTSAFSPASVASIGSNPDEAASRISFSRERVKTGREDLAAKRVGEAAVEALAAQEAAGQAQAFLDGVGRVGKDLTEAGQRTEAAIAETQRDIAEAQAAGVAAQLAPLMASAQAAVTAASSAAAPEGGRDPLGALRHLNDADAALERALQQVRDQQAQRARAAAALERTLVAARAQSAAADDYITTHRGAVGGQPRALLAEAQNALVQAAAFAESDPVTAGKWAANAHDLATRALTQAQGDTQQATSSSGIPGLGMGSTIIGAILGGVLASSLGGGGMGSGLARAVGGGLAGGLGRALGGGGTPGSFAPPSFGGMGTRMRRGGGGRF